MEAAKKIYENSYNDRLEAAVSAKAYLDHMDNERKISEVVINKRKNTGRLCNVIGIVSSIAYCALVLCILLYPLVKETELHRLNAAFSDYKNELRALDKDIEDARAVLSDQTVISHIEKVATEELGLIRRSTGNKIEIQTDEYFTLEEARENYYNKTYHKALQGNIE